MSWFRSFDILTLTLISRCWCPSPLGSPWTMPPMWATASLCRFSFSLFSIFGKLPTQEGSSRPVRLSASLARWCHPITDPVLLTSISFRTGPHVFNGGFSTFLSVVIFAYDYVLWFRTFFKVHFSSIGWCWNLLHPGVGAAHLLGALPRPGCPPSPALVPWTPHYPLLNTLDPPQSTLEHLAHTLDHLLNSTGYQCNKCMLRHVWQYQ